MRADQRKLDKGSIEQLRNTLFSGLPLHFEHDKGVMLINTIDSLQQRLTAAEESVVTARGVSETWMKNFDMMLEERNAATARAEKVEADKKRLDAIQDAGWEIGLSGSSDEDSDHVFVIYEHYMAAPHKRELTRNTDLRIALDDAMKIDPYSVTKAASIPKGEGQGDWRDIATAPRDGTEGREDEC